MLALASSCANDGSMCDRRVMIDLVQRLLPPPTRFVDVVPRRVTAEPFIREILRPHVYSQADIKPRSLCNAAGGVLTYREGRDSVGIQSHARNVVRLIRAALVVRVNTLAAVLAVAVRAVRVVAGEVAFAADAQSRHLADSEPGLLFRYSADNGLAADFARR